MLKSLSGSMQPAILDFRTWLTRFEFATTVLEGGVRNCSAARCTRRGAAERTTPAPIKITDPTPRQYPAYGGEAPSGAGLVLVGVLSSSPTPRPVFDGAGTSDGALRPADRGQARGAADSLARLVHRATPAGTSLGRNQGSVSG